MLEILHKFERNYLKHVDTKNNKNYKKQHLLVQYKQNLTHAHTHTHTRNQYSDSDTKWMMWELWGWDSVIAFFTHVLLCSAFWKSSFSSFDQLSCWFQLNTLFFHADFKIQYAIVRVFWNINLLIHKMLMFLWIIKIFWLVQRIALLWFWFVISFKV